MKRNSRRPKSLPEMSKGLSIQRPKSLPVISKRTFSIPKQPHLIYSPSKSAKSTNSLLYSSATRSPLPAAKIKPVLPIDLSQYEALLPQKHAYPLKIVAIYYITLVCTIINSFCYNIANILKRINDTNYIKPPLFKKTAIERLIALQQKILNEQYDYKALDGTIINISGIYKLIVFLLFKKTKKEDIRLYNYLRSYLYNVKMWNYDKAEREMSKLYRNISILRTDADMEEYMRIYFINNIIIFFKHGF